jgi:hypothetical protein
MKAISFASQFRRDLVLVKNSFVYSSRSLRLYLWKSPREQFGYVLRSSPCSQSVFVARPHSCAEKPTAATRNVDSPKLGA